MSRTDPQFNLRIPESLRDLVMAAAKENKRSATAEILARLERSFTDPDELGFNDQERLRGRGPGADHEAAAAPRVKGVRKELLLKSIENAQEGDPITRADLYSAVDQAIEHALGRLRIGATSEHSNTGPKPRKRYLKEKG